MITNPANVDPKVKIMGAAAGSTGSTFCICFPPSPRATRNTIKTGIQASRSYLQRLESACNLQAKHGSTYQLRILYPQKDTKREMTTIMTIPTLGLGHGGYRIIGNDPRPAEISIRNSSKGLSTENTVQYRETTHPDEVENAGNDDTIVPSDGMNGDSGTNSSITHPKLYRA